MSFNSIAYSVDGRVATITLNRPEALNAIDQHLPTELSQAVDMANRDKNVHVIVLTGAGRAFCSGYDLKHYAQTPGANEGQQDMPWDPMVDFDLMYGNTEKFMSLWRSHKPTIAKVNGYAVAGGSDIALCCDLVVMSEDAKIGYPPARVWGIPTPAMWVYRLGAEKAKRMLFTGDLVSGAEAKSMGLVLDAVPHDQLDATVDRLAARMSGVPRNQLMMSKLMINSAFDNMGLKTTQMFASLFDGVARHSPEGVWFKERAEQVGFKQAVQERDSGDPIAPGVSR
jgi:enoyl-CoA hydratase